MNSKEIAKMAGVSRSTVTRVVNNYPDISEKTRKKVLDVIEKYQYAPDSSARILAGKQPKEIGLFLGIDKEKKVSSSMYYGELITYVIDRAEELGYSVLTSIIKNEDYLNVAKFLNTNSIQGAIVIGGNDKVSAVIDLKKSHKIIFIEQFYENSEVTNHFGLTNIENYLGACMATEYLIRNGHLNIMHVTGRIGSFSSKERLRGYKDTLIKNNIPIDEKLIIEADYSEDVSEKIMLDYLKTNSLPSAIFAVTDLTAIGVIQAIKKLGFKVPNDVSVIGFDDIYISSAIEPRLTTICTDIKGIAYKTVDELIYAIENNIKPKTSVITDVKIIERDSVLRK